MNSRLPRRCGPCAAAIPLRLGEAGAPSSALGMHRAARAPLVRVMKQCKCLGPAMKPIGVMLHEPPHSPTPHTNRKTASAVDAGKVTGEQNAAGSARGNWEKRAGGLWEEARKQEMQLDARRGCSTTAAGAASGRLGRPAGPAAGNS